MPRVLPTFLLWLPALSLACGPSTALADPSESLLTSYTQYGERQLDLEYGTRKASNQLPASSATLGLGLEVSATWYAELYLAYSLDGGTATHFDAAAVQNTFVLTRGTQPIDVALYTEVEYERDRAEGYQVTAGPLFESEFELTTANLNLLFHRNYRADQTSPMQLSYQWQIKRRISHNMEFGVQGFGELGAWDHWAPQNQQEHRFGPVVLGKLALDPQRVIHYNVSVLFDAFDHQNAATLRMQAIIGF